MQRQDVRQQPWMNYVDLEYRCGDPKATKLGAQVALPKMPVPGVWAVAASWIPRGTFAGCGNRRGSRPSQHQPEAPAHKCVLRPHAPSKMREFILTRRGAVLPGEERLL
jgi:hypothetical protein